MRSGIHYMCTVLNSLKPRNAALIEACVIGLVAGFSAFILKEGVRLLSTGRLHEAVSSSAYLVFPAIGCIGGLVAGWLVERVAPEATGSGIPQVKALLARIAVKFDLRVALVKPVGGKQWQFTQQVGSLRAARNFLWNP